MHRPALPLAIVLALAGCQQADHLEITPRQPVLKTRGESVQLVVRVMARQYEIVKQHVDFTSKDPFIATVDDKGVVRPIASGIAHIQAKHGDIVAEVPVEVSLVEALRSDVDAVELSYEAGDPAKPHVIPIGFDGRELHDRPVFFTSKDERVCRVDGSGQFWPVEKGETTVNARIDDKEVEIKCTVGK
jgi:hypothetical protein